MTPCSREFYKKENLYKIYRIPGELGTKTADMLRLCVLLVAARAVASSVMDCSGTLNLAQSEILCNSSTSGGRITHTATNTSIDCRGAYLNGYKTTQARDIVISDCRVDAPSFTGVSSEALIRNCVLNGTTFYAGAAIYFERTHLKYIAVSGAADYNITIGPRSSVLTIVVVSGAKMLVDYEGEEKTQLTINSDGLCAVRRFPPASILCAITRNCTYSGMFFSGCITTPNATAPDLKTLSATLSAPKSHTNTASWHKSVTGSSSANTRLSPTESDQSITPRESASRSVSRSLRIARSPLISGSASLTLVRSATPTAEQAASPDPAAPPAPETPPAAVPQAAKTTGLVAGTTAAALSSGSAAGAARVGAIGLMIRCERNYDALPSYWDFPLQDYVNRSFSLTLLIVALANLALQGILAFCYFRKHVNPVMKLLPPLLLGYQSPAFASAAAGRVGDPLVIIAIALMLLALIYPSAMTLMRPKSQADYVLNGSRKIGGQEMPDGALYGQFGDVEGGVYCELFGEYVGGVRSHSSLSVRTGIILEIWLGVICGIFSGLRGEAGACVLYSFVILGLSICFSIYQVVVAPFSSIFERRSAQGKAIAMVFLSALGCGAMVQDQLEACVGWLSLGLLLYMPGELCVGFLLDRRADQAREKYLVESACEGPLLEAPKVVGVADSSGTFEEPRSAPFVRVNPLL
jgi:hypothetical protein